MTKPADTTKKETQEKPTTTETAAAASPTTTTAQPATEPPLSILSAQHWAETALPDIPDNDSSIGDDNASSTVSISSSILHYRTINGRTYHSERGNASYWASNDERANESADLV
jgi:hypothetical protein